MSEAAKPELMQHPQGNFCWVELGTTDAAAAKKFYTSLFGWQAEDTPAGPDMVYTMLRLGGREVGALYPQDKAEAQHGVPPHWNVYVAVESADATAARAKELGGTVLMDPFEVMEHGRMTIVQDPTGGTICVWQARNHVGARVVREPGAASPRPDFANSSVPLRYARSAVLLPSPSLGHSPLSSFFRSPPTLAGNSRST
jgi:hypothetical protein